MKKTILILVAIAIMVLLPEFANELFAQPFNPNGATGLPVGSGSPTGVPIDGGLSFLAAAGIAYAGKKLHEKKQSGKQLNQDQ